MDLGRYASAREVVESVAVAGLISTTSSHSFFSRAGMTRGAILKVAMNLCGPGGWKEGTPAFDDVPPESPCSISVMAVHSAGFLPETGENPFYPERWISGEDVQRILSGILSRLGPEDREFSFTPGTSLRFSRPTPPGVTWPCTTSAGRFPWRRRPSPGSCPYGAGP